LHKSKQERENDADLANDPPPSPEQMYRWLQTMAAKIDNLERENMHLKQTHKKKIQVIEWLNSHPPPDLTFSSWVNKQIIPFVYTQLDCVYKTDLLNGMTQLFDRAFAVFETEKIPICSFDNKPNTLYIYKIVLDETTKEEHRKWVYVSNSDFDAYLSIISQQFMVDFNNHWYCKNKEKIEIDETYKDTYVNYYKSVLGGDRISDDNRNQRIRQHIIKAVKRNIKNITEYDVC
jgi:hypothetical protein